MLHFSWLNDPSKILFCLTFIPAPFLALVLKTPTYPDITRILVSWDRGDGDPEDIQLHIKCENFTSPFHFATPTVFLRAVFPVNNFNFPPRPGQCEFQATDLGELDPPTPSQVLATSPPFQIVQEPNATGSPTRTTMIATRSVEAPSSGASDPFPSAPGVKPVSHLVSGDVIKAATLGSTLLFLPCVILAFYCWRKYHNRNNRISSGPNESVPDNEAKNSTLLSILSRFRRRGRSTYDTNAHPLVHSEGYSPPEGKRERLERVQREMEETQRQREILQVDLDRRSNNDGIHGSDGRIDINFEMLSHQIEQLSRRIRELELERQEGSGQYEPPDYYSSSSVR